MSDQQKGERLLVSLTRKQWSRLLAIEDQSGGKIVPRAQVLELAKTGKRQPIVDYLKTIGIDLDKPESEMGHV